MSHQKKIEQVLELLINEEHEAASELLHSVIVEKARDLYEEIVDEDEFGGDETEDFADEIEADEEGIALEGEDEEDLEDRVVDLEDKLDELMAEFEELMMDKDEEEAPEMDMDAEEGPEEVEGDEEEEMAMPMESEEEIAEETEEEQVDEAVSLKPVKADNADHATNKTSPVAADGGKKEKLADAHPAKTEQETGRPAPKAKELPHGTTEPDLKKV